MQNVRHSESVSESSVRRESSAGSNAQSQVCYAQWSGSGHFFVCIDSASDGTSSVQVAALRNPLLRAIRMDFSRQLHNSAHSESYLLAAGVDTNALTARLELTHLIRVDESENGATNSRWTSASVAEVLVSSNGAPLQAEIELRILATSVKNVRYSEQSSSLWLIRIPAVVSPNSRVFKWDFTRDFSMQLVPASGAQMRNSAMFFWRQMGRLL